MWFYEPGGYSPKPEVLDHFKRDQGALAVEAIEDARLTPNGLQVLVKWLGFQENDSSWEPVEIIHEDVPDVLKEFILSERGDAKVNDQIKEYLSTTMNNLSEMSLNHLAIHPVVPSLSKGWLPIEKIILKQCILVYGRYQEFIKGGYLPHKTRQQMYTQTQVLVGKQSIQEYQYLKLDVAEVKAYNVLKYGVAYYVEKNKIYSKAAQLQRKFFNIFRFCRKEKLIQPKDIYFFRRLDKADLHKEKYLKLLNIDSERDLKNIHPPIKFKDLADEIKHLKELIDQDKEFESRKRDIEIHLGKFCKRLQLEVWKANKLKLPFAFSHGQDIFEVFYDDQDNLLKFSNPDLNLESPLFVPKSIPIKVDLSKDSSIYIFLKQKGIYFDAIIIDPPWKVLNSNPTRGPSGNYKLMDFDEIPFKQIFSSVLNGYIFIWVVAKFENKLRRLLADLELVVLDSIVWIKKSSNGALHSSLSQGFNRAKETCLVIKKGSTPSSQLSNYFGVDVIFAPRMQQSRKPTAIHEMLEKNFRDASKFGEFFARTWNVRAGWMSLGDDISGGLEFPGNKSLINDLL
eukprot:snap_masked-scaffold_4-processed-gene-6.9-mRNA-1 protein AED:0.43 eAED:0.43 QI:0/0/0/0.5/1/1/2/0/567